MARKNLFHGEGYFPLCASTFYNILKERDWCSFDDIIAKIVPIERRECSITKYPFYKDLKKAACQVRKEIASREGDNCIEERGNNRAKEFRYIGKSDDPLADLLAAKIIYNIGIYREFCQNSAGILPFSWFEYFFHDCTDLIRFEDTKRKGKQIISASLDRILKNIEYLPILYEAITKQQVLSIEYKPFGKEPLSLTVHPHFLKEYNGRWHLFGHAEEQEPQNGYDIALDRILQKPKPAPSKEYINAPKGFYTDFFKDIIGVSHREGEKAVDITIRAHSFYIYKLTETKPLHPSQTVVLPFGKHEEDGEEYGDFQIHVEPNNEFFGRILHMGEGLEVVSPEEVRDEFRRKVKAMSERYD